MRIVFFALLMLLPVQLVLAESLIEGKPFAEHFLLLQASDEQALKQDLVLSVANNVLAAFGPDEVEIEVVAFGAGVQLLDKTRAAAARIELLAAQGVRFYVCAISLATYERQHGQPLPLHDRAIVVAAGVPYMMRRHQQGYVLIKP